MRRFHALLVVLAFTSAAPVGQTPLPPGQGTPPPAPAGTGFIAGVVVDSVTGQAIPEVMVSMSGRGARGGRGQAIPAIISDERGRFFFRNLAPATYQLQANKPGYGSVRPGQLATLTVELADGERVLDVRVRLAKYGVITGTVRDVAGDPVVGTDVLLFRRAAVNGRPGWQSTGRARTDDRGQYRLPSVTAGDFLVCACLRDPNPLDPVLLTTLASEPVNLLSVAARALTVGADVVSLDDTLRTYAPTFHPNSQTAARAVQIKVAPGEEKAGIDITAELVRATRVSGRVTGMQSSVTASSIRLVPVVDLDAGISITALSPMLVQPDGRFDFANVPPGQYRLVVHHRETGSTAGGPSGIALGFAGARAAGPPPAPVAISGPSAVAPMWADESISVGDRGLRDLIIGLRPGPVITGRFQFVGAAAQPTGQVLTRSSFGLQQVSSPSVLNSAFGSTAADGSFRLAGAVPGRYVPIDTEFPGYATLKSVTVGGADVTDLPIEVGAKDLSDLVVTLTDIPLATLAVSLPPSIGPKEDEFVLVFPQERKYWQEPFAARRRLRSVPVTQKGIVSVPALPAGDYFIILVAGDETVDWQEAGKLEALSRRAQRVNVGVGGTQTVEVRR